MTLPLLWHHFESRPGLGYLVSSGAVTVASVGAGSLTQGEAMLVIAKDLGLLAGAVLALVGAMKHLIARSDRKTEKVVAAQAANMAEDVATVLRRDLESFRGEQYEKNRAQATREELLGMAGHVGGLDQRVAGVEHDLNALHAWKRETETWMADADVLLKTWRQEMLSKKLQPPDGWTEDPTKP